ncbi:MAG: hypothetical protein R3D85_15560 [Paracoccaceae bacterium]
MSILVEVFTDLFKMFPADARMTAAILALVAGVAAGLHYGWLGAGPGGALLLVGALALVVLSVLWAAWRHGK